ncbi:MAG: PAS domain-containing sensor histidine kinase, partial [Gammaproteobacteria bacterium]
MYKSGWMGEKWRLLGILLLGAVSGLLSGQWLLCFLICISCYALWHLKQLRRVEQWLRHQGGEDSAPVAFGLWNELINHIYRLHKRHDKILQHQNKLAQRFEQTAQATPDATIVIGQHGDIRWANTAAERYIGIRNPGDIGVRLTNLIRDPEFAQFINQASADSSININSPVDSNTHLNVRMVPYRDGEYLLTARDISELIRADAMRRDFISNASHELKTPLTVMMGYLELLESEPGIAED